MDKFKKQDSHFATINIMPDISKIVKPAVLSPPKRDTSTIFKQDPPKPKDKPLRPLDNPIISDEVESEIIDDTEDIIEDTPLIPKPVRRRTKDKKPRKKTTRDLTEARENLARARLIKKEKRINNLETKRKQAIIDKKQAVIDKREKEAKDITDAAQAKIDAAELEEWRKERNLKKATKQQKAVSEYVEKSTKNIVNNFETFCDYMTRYEKNKSENQNEKSQIHPNKMVNKNLLPRPPNIENVKTLTKREIAAIKTNKKLNDPMYAINMLTKKKQLFKHRFKY
jgi:hypothetical protein